MDRHELRRLHGMASLITEAVDASVVALAETHQAIARQPYAYLAAVAPIAIPASLVERTQGVITASVYLAVRVVNLAVGATASALVRQLDESDGPH